MKTAFFGGVTRDTAFPQKQRKQKFPSLFLFRYLGVFKVT